MTATRQQIRSIVADVLARPAAQGRPINVARVARAYGIAVVYRAFEGDEDISGFYLREKGERVIGVNNAQAPVRQRFTIAHELGHALLDERDRVHVDGAFNLRLRDVKSSLAIDPDEMAANHFAAELLMPGTDVRSLVGDGIDITDDAELRGLARHFGVSQQAMAYRLMNLGLGIDGKAKF